jgi:hypothetical protein
MYVHTCVWEKNIRRNTHKGRGRGRGNERRYHRYRRGPVTWSPVPPHFLRAQRAWQVDSAWRVGQQAWEQEPTLVEARLSLAVEEAWLAPLEGDAIGQVRPSSWERRPTGCPNTRPHRIRLRRIHQRVRWIHQLDAYIHVHQRVCQKKKNAHTHTHTQTHTHTRVCISDGPESTGNMAGEGTPVWSALRAAGNNPRSWTRPTYTKTPWWLPTLT